MREVIGVAGRKYHGKDTVARIAAAQGYEIVRFAGPLKAMLRAFYREHGLPDYDIDRKIEGDLKEVPCPLLLGKTPRYAMQTLGTEWGRQCIGESLWTESLVRRVEQHERAIVPDVRFRNECDTIHRMGGRVVRVEASQRVPANEHSQHASEGDIDRLPVDVEINNNGTEFELKHAVEGYLSLPA